jgi:hypothetical protein
MDRSLQRLVAVGRVGVRRRSAEALGRLGFPAREEWRESQRRGKGVRGFWASRGEEREPREA